MENVMRTDPGVLADKRQEWFECGRERGDVPAGDDFQSWRLRILSQETFRALGSDQGNLSRLQGLYLLGFGLLAPTSHNTVPQRFRLLPNGDLSLWLDRRFVLPASDPEGRQATVSCGCSAAFIQLAAAAFGCRAETEILGVKPDDTVPLAAGLHRYVELAHFRIERSEGRQGARAWLDAMLERKSIRAEYDASVRLDPEVIGSMEEAVRKYPKISLHLLTDAITLVAMGKLQELADTIVFNHDKFARELGQWLLPNDADSRLGMRGREYGLNDQMARHFHLGLRRLERLLPDEIAGLAKASSLGIRTSSAVVVLTATDDSPQSRFEAGQACGELTLLLQMKRYAVSMHAAVTEVTAPNMALRGRLRTRHRPMAVFRVGRPARTEDANRPHAARPCLQEVLLTDDEIANPGKEACALQT